MKAVALSDFDADIEAPRQVAWTPEEDRCIREHYVSKGAKYVGKLLPHRSLNSIRGHSYQLGIRQWVRSPEAVAERHQSIRELLRSGFKTLEVCELLGVSSSMVRRVRDEVSIVRAP